MFLNQLPISTRLWFQAAKDQFSRWQPIRHTFNPTRRWLELSALEERVFLSASPAGAVVPEAMEVAVPVETDPAATGESAEGPANLENSQIDPLLAALEVESSPSTQTLAEEESVQPRELVFIDAGVRDAEVLLNDLGFSQNEGRAMEVFFLEADRDGAEQIAEVLANYENLDAVHIVSHGRDGAVKLGNDWLDADRLAAESDTMAQWSLALSEEADLLFYGCDVAAGEEGRAFISSLGQLTGADVAASVDATGGAMFGGNWKLEYAAGSVEAVSAFRITAQENYGELLATLTVSTTNDVLDGDTSSISALIANQGSDGFISLREAIIATNNTSGMDEIFLSAGVYSLSLTGTGEDGALTGDLDIEDNLILTGADASTTIIDAGGIDRVFEVRSGGDVFTATNLTIQGGDTNDQGGGIFVQNSNAQVTLGRVILTGNMAGDGAGIFNGGTLFLTDVVLSDNGDADTMEGGGLYQKGTATLNRVTISGNLADVGAGIHQDNGASSLTLTNVTVSGNVAATCGGGLYAQSFVSITNSTFTANLGNSTGGISNNGGTISLTNSIVAGNIAMNLNSDVQGPFSSNGFNLIGNPLGGSGFVGFDILGVGALLQPLADNGGFGQTHALQVGSLALNAGTITGAPAIDGRGIIRDAAPDIGAYEAGASAVNTPPTDISLSHNAIGESANTAGGFRVAMLSAVDPNGAETLTYSIQGGADAAKFSVGGTELLLNDGDLDFERQSSYEVVVRVTDSVNNTYDELFTIAVIDENDAPVLNLAPLVVEENSPAGTIVGTITALEQDAGDSYTLEIISGNRNNAFTLDANTGELRVANAAALDYDNWPSFDLLVLATDSQGATDQAVIQVSLTNISLPPTAVNDVVIVQSRIIELTNQDFAGNDFSPEGEKLVVAGFGNLSGGQIVDNGNQTYTATLAEGVTEANFTYFIRDVSGNTASATMTLILDIQKTPGGSPTVPDLTDVLPIQPNVIPRPAPTALAPAPQADRAPTPQAAGGANTSEDETTSPSGSSSELKVAPAPGLLSHRGNSMIFTTVREGGEVLPAVFTETNAELLSPEVVTIAHTPSEMRAWSAESFSWEYDETVNSTTTPMNPNSPTENDVVVIDMRRGSVVWQDLDTMEEDLQTAMEFQTIVVGAAVTVSSTLTVGYALWMIRGGVLVGSLLAQMPAWRFIDPLPILEYLDQNTEEDNESLETIINDASMA